MVFIHINLLHELISSCAKETDRIFGSSSMRGRIHRAIASVEKRKIFGSSTLYLLSIDKHSSFLRSTNIGDSGFMLIRNEHLIQRSHPQYHRGSSPFQLSSFPTTHSNPSRLYHDKYVPHFHPSPSICLFSLSRASDGEYIEDQLQIGDLLLVASDGLFDNLYEDFLIQIINNHLIN
jgi:protein phosphatase PTC7